MPANKADITLWVEKYSDSMYNWTLTRVSDPVIAEDMVQETFLSAVKAIHSFKEKSNPKTWLFSILKNKIADHFRKQFKLETVNESEISGDDDIDFFGRYFSSSNEWKKEYYSNEWSFSEDELLDDNEFREILEKCLRALNKKSLLSIQYKYIEEKDGKVICQELGITPSNFWQLLHRAKIQLRACLSENWFNNK
jgi:RNA polymerase sigma-70 factor (ECF subfamily)